MTAFLAGVIALAPVLVVAAAIVVIVVICATNADLQLRNDLLLADLRATRAELAAAEGTDSPAPADRDDCLYCRGAGVFDAGLDFETGKHIDMPCGSCAGTGQRTNA